MHSLYCARSTQGEAIAVNQELNLLLKKLSTSTKMLKWELAYWNKRKRVRHDGNCSLNFLTIITGFLFFKLYNKPSHHMPMERTTLIDKRWRLMTSIAYSCELRRRVVVVITTAKLHSTKSELRFCAGSNPTHGVSEICDGKNLWQWSWLEIRRKRLLSINHSAKTNHH